MIISRTPYRISFFGGGTDYPVWFKDHPGAVLATSINKYAYILCRTLPPFFDYKWRIVYSKMENVNRIDEIQHPTVRESLRLMEVKDGIELNHDGDLPARTGLGSSSTFTVGVLHALHALQGRMADKRQLANEAIRVEQEMARENVGCQDQVTAAFGGFNRIDFRPDGAFALSPVILAPERLEALQSHLMLVFTGFARTASEVAAEQIRETPNRVAELTEAYRLVGAAVDVLRGTGDLSEFGRLLDAGWRLKRSLTDRVSTPAIDAIYERALKAGALGGKLLGAGGGGFMLLWAAPERQQAVRAALRELLHVPIRFEASGSQIIFYDPAAMVRTAP